AGHHQIFHGVGRKSCQGINLLGYAHGAQLSRDAGANAPSHHQAGQHGPQLARDGKSHHIGNGAFGVKARKTGVTLQGQNHAGKKGCHGNDGQRVIANGQTLLADLPKIKRRAKNMPHRCYCGYHSKGGAAGVGNATTSAVVLSSIVILIANYILTGMFFSK
ncbi:MAG: hypothetical protein EBZ69_02745, partial [Alphaproteobacteria bacterium]|nr:hypothetical protein [Alphaproteobacteria bacterium]